MQQVLLYRELGMSLADIRRVLDDPRVRPQTRARATP
jgi:DNA-binding transcriptional MerR regulator